MWTRSLLKNNAKQALSRNLGKAILVCLVADLFISGGGRSATFTYRMQSKNPQFVLDFQYFWHQHSALITLIFLVTLILSVLFSLLVRNVIQVGRNRFFMESRVGLPPFSSLFSAFSSPTYWNIVKTLFLRDIYIFLWSLLFIIPGIVKSYEYSMIPYLLAENPGMSAERAFALSREMTFGEKASIFVLDLSFFGWSVVCLFTFGIGYFFLSPYVQATYAELYAALRAKIFARGITDYNELGDFVRY